MSEQAGELVAGSRERLRAYEVKREEEVEAVRTAPVSEPGPSISCIGDLAASIGAKGAATIKHD
jgi:hypothetical protein